MASRSSPFPPATGLRERRRAATDQGHPPALGHEFSAIARPTPLPAPVTTAVPCGTDTWRLERYLRVSPATMPSAARPTSGVMSSSPSTVA